MDVSGYLRAVDSATVVAFDVFDTLIVRPFYRPKDLFSFLEEESGLAGFREARVAAEHDARKVDPETDLDLIYQHLAHSFQPLKEKEIESEISFTKPDSDALKVFRYALEQGKKVIVVSDMYLSSECIGKILSGSGFSGYSDLYVSSETKLSKRGGGMYDVILDDLAISPSGVLMIGDNQRADVEAAVSKGLQTMRWVSLKERYASTHRKEIRFVKKNPGYGPSLLVGMDILGWSEQENESYWHSVARRFGGPMNVAFAKFVMENSADSDGIVFFSRDGYMPMVVYGILGGEKPYVYLHTSRMTAKVFGSRDLSERDTALSVMDYLRASGRAPDMEIPSKARYREFLAENGVGVEQVLSEAHERYSRYLEGVIGDMGRFTVADATTMRYTSQTDVMSYLPDRKVRGCYYAVTVRGGPDHVEYRDRSREFISSSRVNLAEFFLGSGERSVLDIGDDGEIVFEKDVSPAEEVRMRAFPEIRSGIEECARSYLRVFGERVPCIPGDVMDGWVAVLMAEEKGNDPDTLSGIKWAVNTQHSIYKHLIVRFSDIPGLILLKFAGLVQNRRSRR